ncbi:MAG: histidinol dehydrogenase [Nitrospirota bacterium]
MKIIKDKEIKTFLKKLEERASASVNQDEIQRVVRNIIADVKKDGDRAVKKYTEKFDSIKLKQLLVSKREVEASAKNAGKEFLKALKQSVERVKTFHAFQRDESWYFSEKNILLGQILKPMERVGVYVPGGKASYPSTVLMNVIPAQVAGVKEIALCVPTPGGKINPEIAAAIKLLGVKEVYRIGGAQAIAALAYGTETIRRVDKIAGPGNVYVAAAKRMVFGDVGIDMIAGPSEVLIIADKTANAAFIAADMLSQAEHDEMASSVLITDSEALADKVTGELASQMKTLNRKEIANKSLDLYGAVIVVNNLKTAFELANRIAPEHLEIMTKKPEHYLPQIKNAGSIFLGEWSPEALGDYAAGPNHTLPTGGTSRFSSPLGVYDFMKRSSLLMAKKEGFLALAKAVETLADVEGLEAHGNTIRVRRRKAY